MIGIDCAGQGGTILQGEVDDADIVRDQVSGQGLPNGGEENRSAVRARVAPVAAGSFDKRPGRILQINAFQQDNGGRIGDVEQGAIRGGVKQRAAGHAKVALGTRGIAGNALVDHDTPFASLTGRKSGIIKCDGITTFDDRGFRTRGCEGGFRDGDVPGGIYPGRVHAGGLDSPAGYIDCSTTPIGGNGAGTASGGGHIDSGKVHRTSLGCHDGMPAIPAGRDLAVRQADRRTRAGGEDAVGTATTGRYLAVGHG